MRKQLDVRFKKVAIIGVGLIGGSLGLAIKKKKLARSVIGIGRRHLSIQAALRYGAVDVGTKDLRSGVRDADLVIVATPVCTITKIVKKIVRDLKSGAILTDVGSTKSQIIEEIEIYLRDRISFVGSHPLAGSEKRGVNFANADLFRGSTVIMTKTRKTKSSSIKALSQFWRSLGVARVVVKTPEEHDRIVAEISHLPHLMATALINSVSDKSLKFAAGGFKDATRIAASDPDIWRDICVTNRRQILKSLDRFERSLLRIKALIKNASREKLYREFAKSKRIREKLN